MYKILYIADNTYWVFDTRTKTYSITEQSEKGVQVLQKQLKADFIDRMTAFGEGYFGYEKN